jgi:hypothetical protein
MASKKILISVDVTTKSAEVSVDKVVKSLKELDGATTNVTKSLDKNRAQSGLNNAILIELGRTASDASYGFQGMANNIGRLFELGQEFARTGKQRGSLNSALQDLKNSIFGVGGLLIGVQLLIGFLPKIAKLFKKNAEAVDEETQAIERQNKQIRENIRLRTQNADKAEDFINLFTEDFQRIITNIDYDSSKVEAKLFELGEKFTELGIERAQLLQDENLSQGDRVQIAVKLIELFNKETEALKLRRKLEAAAGQDKGVAFMLKRDLTNLRLEIFGLEDDIDRISKKGVEVIPSDGEDDGIGQFRAKVKTLAEMSKNEFDDLYNYLFDRGEDFRFFVQKLNEGWTVEQIRQTITVLKTLGEESMNAFDEFSEEFLEKQKDITAFEQIELKTRENIQKVYVRSLGEVGRALNDLGVFSDDFKKAAIIADKAQKITEIILETKSSNTKIKLLEAAALMAGDLSAPIRSKALRASNTISAGINIAAIVAQAASGIAAINSKSNVPTGIGGGGGGGAAISVEAPDFNVVGAGGVSQLATGLAGITGKPIQAFVVSKEISSAQELDRNITNNASLG